MKILSNHEWKMLNERLARLEKAAFMNIYDGPYWHSAQVVPVSEFCKEIYYQENLEWVMPSTTPGHFRKKQE